MAVIVIFDPLTTPNKITAVHLSASTPDYAGRTDFVENPDLSALQTVAQKYWKHVAGAIIEMTILEKDLVDADLARSEDVQKDGQLSTSDITSKEMVEAIIRSGNQSWRLGQALTKQDFLSMLRFVALPPKIALPQISGVRGTSVSLDVSFSARVDDVAGLQFDVILPAGISFSSVAAGPAAISAGKGASGVSNAAGFRVIIFGFNQNVIGSGVVCTVTLSIGVTAPLGIVVLTIFRTVCSGPGGSTVKSVGGNGQITVA